MYRIALIIILLILPFAVPAQTTAAYKTFSDPKKGLSIQYPANWESRKIKGTVFFLIRPKEEAGQKFAENVNLMIDPPDDLSLLEYGDVARDKLKKQLPNYQELKWDVVKLGGRDYFRLFYTFTYNNLNMHDVYYVTVYKDQSYSFSCSAIETTFAKYAPVFEKMITSFKVK